MPRHPCVSRTMGAVEVIVTWCDRTKRKFPLREESVYLCRPKKSKEDLLMQCRKVFKSETEIIIDAKIPTGEIIQFVCVQDEQEFFNNSNRKRKE